MKLLLMFTILSGCVTSGTTVTPTPIKPITRCYQVCRNSGMEMWQYSSATCHCKGNKVIYVTKREL